jgi:hypothetical protein
VAQNHFERQLKSFNQTSLQIAKMRREAACQLAWKARPALTAVVESTALRRTCGQEVTGRRHSPIKWLAVLIEQCKLKQFNRALQGGGPRLRMTQVACHCGQQARIR